MADVPAQRRVRDRPGAGELTDPADGTDRSSATSFASSRRSVKAGLVLPSTAPVNTWREGCFGDSRCLQPVTRPVRGDGAPIHPQPSTVMPPQYLFELRYRDGRIESQPSGEFTGSTPLEPDLRVWLNGMWWRVCEVRSAPGYEAKVILDEE